MIGPHRYYFACSRCPETSQEVHNTTYGVVSTALCLMPATVHRVQSKTLGLVALELSGIQTTVVDGKAVPS